MSFQYGASALVRHNNVVFSRRPNAGSQFTSEVTRIAEQSSAELVLRLDVAVPPNATAQRRQPLIVWLHGGGLVSGGKEEFADHVVSYARAGYVAASVNYRLTPGIETNFAARVRALLDATDDAMNAIRFLKANAATYGIDPTRVAVFGNSAGGTVALVNAVEFDTLSGAVLDYPGVSSKVQAAVATVDAGRRQSERRCIRPLRRRRHAGAAVPRKPDRRRLRCHLERRRSAHQGAHRRLGQQLHVGGAAGSKPHRRSVARWARSAGHQVVSLVEAAAVRDALTAR